jgi:hypothetical protein
VSGRQLRPAAQCLNCGHAVQSRYCSECGQENTDYRVSLWRLLADLFEELFQLESRLWRSLWTMVRYPGRLTRDYNAGRRVLYTSPLRLYLLASFTYFFAAALVPPAHSGPTELKVEMQGVDLENLPPPKGKIDRLVRERLGILKRLDPKEASRRARETLIANTPKVMVILVPLFALLVQMLFWRHFFVEHLVFALHAHAFAYFLMTLGLLTRSDALGSLTLLLSAVWVLIALKNVYAQSWGRVLWKTLVLSLLYSILVLFGIVVALIGGLLWG